VGNEENGYPVSDSNKTMINVTDEASNFFNQFSERRTYLRKQIM
jgi:hypothetical protein